MKRKTPIRDLTSLKLAQTERRAEIIEREVKIRLKANAWRESLADLSFFSNNNKSGIKNILVENISPLTSMLSSFFINKIIKPKSRWVRRLSTLISSFVIEKYSGTLQFVLNTLLKEDDFEKCNKH